jgi:predicted GNAT family acetyltransferase
VTSPQSLEVVDVPERHRFEARIGSKLVGISQYEIRGGVIALLHTEIDADQEGKGYGSQLARAVLADVRARDVSVIVRCPFLAAFVRRHQAEYPDIDLRAGKSRIAG